MIVLDTHAWLWWSDAPERLSGRAREAIDAEAELGVSAISCWELGMLVVRARIGLDREAPTWIAQAIAQPRTRVIDVSGEIALAAAQLERESFPADPADRIIYATARSAGAGLISADRAIGRFDAARVIW